MAQISESEYNYYGGSQIFSFLSEYTKLSVDQTNFVISQLVALALAGMFRSIFHPSKTYTEVRHAFGLIFGLWMGYFCFGLQALHLAALPALCYIIILTQSPHIVHGLVLAVALIYLSIVHVQRQISDYANYGLDITGPLMVITQKVTSLAFNLHDGLTKNDSELSNNQKLYAITKIPTALEFFSYTLMFPTLMAGPMIFYNDYKDFIDGTSYSKVNNVNNETVIEPTPVRAVFKKFIIALFCALIFVQFLPSFPISRVKEENFLENTSLTYKMWYLTVATGLVRSKYYFAWTLADAICNNCGIGFNGYNDDGTSKWDKISNVNILKFEFGTSLKESIEAWNMGTNRWLRMVVYERTKKFPTILTYTLSAIWHGFYPGYYFTFASGAIFTVASRTVRRHCRSYFLGNSELHQIYDILTYFVTRMVLSYITFPFVLLEFKPSVNVYMKTFWFLHVLGILAIIIVPKIIPKAAASETSSKSNLANALRRAGPYSNGIGHSD